MAESTPTRAASGLQAELIRLPQVLDGRGALLPVDFAGLPFQPRRLFVVHDVPVGQRRGGHAHRSARQLLICLAGRIEVELRSDGSTRRLTLERPDEGLLVPAGIWAAQTYLEAGSTLLVLTSEAFDPGSYIADVP